MYTKKENIKFNMKAFLKNLFSHVKKDNITMLSSQTTFNLIIALVPFLVIAINILLFFASGKIPEIRNYISKFPREVASIGNSILNFIMSQRNTGILSLGIVIAIWTSSRGVKAMIKSLNLAFDRENSSSFLFTQIKSIIFTLVILLILLILLFGLVFGDVIIGYIIEFFHIEIEIIYKIIIHFSRIVIPLVLMVISFTSMYMFGPTFSKNNLPPILPCFIGGIIATISSITITLGYAYYINNFSNMSSIYGPLVGIMILFLWLNYIILSIIFSGEITAALIRYYYDIDLSQLPKYESLITKIKKIVKKKS